MVFRSLIFSVHASQLEATGKALALVGGALASKVGGLPLPCFLLLTRLDPLTLEEAGGWRGLMLELRSGEDFAGAVGRVRALVGMLSAEVVVFGRAVGTQQSLPGPGLSLLGEGATQEQVDSCSVLSGMLSVDLVVSIFERGVTRDWVHREGEWVPSENPSEDQFFPESTWQGKPLACDLAQLSRIAGQLAKAQDAERN